MRGTWFFCLCVLLLAQSITVAQVPEVLLINNFEDDRTWESQAAEGCTLKVVVDRFNTKEGQASLGLEAEFEEGCEMKECYGGIFLNTPDLRGYAFLRLWMKAEPQKNALAALYLRLTGDRAAIHVMPLSRSGWHLVTVHFSEFQSEGEESFTVLPEEVETISLFVAADAPCTVIVNFDDLVALTDTNDNKIPDVDEADIVGSAKNAEEMANRYFDEGDYEKARKYYEEARSLYQQIGDQEKEKVQEMDSKARESAAHHDVKMAEDFYSRGQYDEAMRAYEKARRGFVTLGDFDMVAQIEDKLQELSELTGKPVPPPPSGQPPDRSSRTPRQRQGGSGLLLVLFIVILVGVGIYFLKFRGKAPTETKPETKPKEKKLLPSEAKAEEVRNLKAKFVYGEISRKEYEKKLRELEE